MSDDYFFKHDFLRSSMTGFIATLDNLFENYQKHINNDKFPIFIVNTGDEVYLSNMSNMGSSGKEHYDYVPRMAMSFSSISIQSDQYTAPGVIGRINVKNKSNSLTVSGLTHLRRIPITIQLGTEVVFSKIHEVLSFVEYYVSAVSHTSLAFEFIHNGIVHQAAFEQLTDFDKDTNFSLGFAGDKREHRLPLSFVLNVQMPAYNLYKAKGFNYIEDPGVFIDTDVVSITNDDETISACNNCNNCKTCKDEQSGRGMIKIIHNMHSNNTSTKGIVSTTIIEKT